MKRQSLTTLTQQVAAANGYAFHSGPAHEIGATVRAYPAAWLEPPTVKKSTGRAEGEITYRTTLHLMTLPTATLSDLSLSTTPVDQDPNTDPWAALETHAMSVAGQLASQNEVCAVTNLSITPARHSMSAHGEISVTMECDITLWFVA